MNVSSIHDIKKELQHSNKEELIELCTKLIKYKVENKELAHYLLFEKHNKVQFIQEVKNHVSHLFTEVNTSNIFFAKKTIRKINRYVQKHCKYAADTEVETQLLIHYIQEFKKMTLNISAHKILVNMLKSHTKKLHKAIAMLHEDLQYDYLIQIDKC